MNEHIITLLSSEEDSNIELAIQLIIGQKIRVTQEMLNAIKCYKDFPITILNSHIPKFFNIHNNNIRISLPSRIKYKKRLYKIKLNQEKLNKGKKFTSKYWKHGRKG